MNQRNADSSGVFDIEAAPEALIRTVKRRQIRLTETQIDKLVEARQSGLTVNQLAERFGIHLSITTRRIGIAGSMGFSIYCRLVTAMRQVDIDYLPCGLSQWLIHRGGNMSTEPDLRPPPPSSREPDWDNLDASYEAPGARDVVPAMPPIPDVTTLDPPKDNWAWTHYDDSYHEPRKPLPAPNREIISEENPLEVDVFYSMRSPYSYLVLSRLAYLHSNFNVNVNIRVIFPIAARTAKPGQKSALGGRWYFWGYSVGIDMARTGRYEGIPWRFASPDPILADTYPPESATQITAPMDKQPYIAWLVRLGNAAELEGKALEFCLAVSPLIWGAATNMGEWPFHVEAAVNSIGMNYNAVIEDIQANPDKYDAVWMQSQIDFQMTGQGGVPTMSFNGEPFFGQDRFNQFFWRLRENGLTKRQVPREPLVARPLRWPSSPGGD